MTGSSDADILAARYSVILMASRHLMAITAHPDDETLGFGGVLAKYASEGAYVSLVTATRGEHGKYFGHAPGTPEHPGTAALAQIRERELYAAASVLGIGSVTLLDYGDSHVDQANSFDATETIANEIRRLRPDVVVTFGADGAYGHPDHIAVSQFATAAILTASDVHRVSKLYYLAWNQAAFDTYQAAFKKLVSMVDGVERQASPWTDWSITTVVDTRRWTDVIWRAVECHGSQTGAYQSLRQLDAAGRESVWGFLSFYRAISLVNGGRKREADLFEGLGCS
jgi:LmbE family N-acetylglucosaminyl deacetylase